MSIYDNRWKVTTEPTWEPVSVTDAKDYLRIQHDEDDLLIDIITQNARAYCEEELDLAIVEQTITLKLDEWPSGKEILLPRSNLISVESVKYQDQDDTETTFTDYVADTYSTPGRIVRTIDNWPTTNQDANCITIVYKAGFSRVPGAVTQALMMLIAHFYDNRTAVTIGSNNTSQELQMAVRACLQKFRRMGV